MNPALVVKYFQVLSRLMRYEIQKHVPNSFAFEDIARQQTLADRMVIRHSKLIVGQAERAIVFRPGHIKDSAMGALQ